MNAAQIMEDIPIFVQTHKVPSLAPVSQDID